MLTAEEKKDLEAIVGERWVHTAPCMMDTYSLYMNPEILNKEGGRFLPRPVAVVLPQSTEEVQALVKYCNRTDLMVKPISTGFGTWAAASRDRVIILDLKRMNRIIEIDVKNQVAVIEPYVRAIDLQTELFKHGLNVHVVSCGGNHSILASTAAAWGFGLTGPSMSYSGRNLLGVEWVMPTGEVLTMGSAGHGSNWFACDGPGPSMRGVVRGFSGTAGGLGVFTKCAVKLYRWDGPATYEIQGQSPNYYLKEMPENMSFNALMFPSWEAMSDAGYLLGEAEIDYAQFRTPMFFIAEGLTDNNYDLKIFLESGFFQKVAKFVLVNTVVGYSEREFNWKMDAMKEILRETGGVRMPLKYKPTTWQLKMIKHVMKYWKDPLAVFRKFPILQKLAQDIPLYEQSDLKVCSKMFLLMIRHAVNVQGTFRPSHGIFTTMGAFDTWDMGIEQGKWIAEAKKPFINKGLIVDDGGDLACGGTFENGHLGYLEGIGLYDTGNPESIMSADAIIKSGVEASINKAMGVPIACFGMEAHQALGPACHDYTKYLAKIKKALDPNTASDPFFYHEPERD